MILAWQKFWIFVLDGVLGWTLLFPRDVTVITLGLILGLVLSAVRHLTVNKTLFQEIKADELRLRSLIRAASVDNQIEQLARYRLTRRLVRERKARLEFASVCVSLVVLLAIMPWGRERLEYLPVKNGEPFQFRVRVPASARGEVIHIVPNKRITCDSGWIRQLESDTTPSGRPVAQAEWTLYFHDASRPEPITIRFERRRYEHRVITDGRFYSQPIHVHDGLVESEILLPPYQPLGCLPQFVLPGLSGWALLMMATTAGVYFGLLPYDKWTCKRLSKDDEARLRVT